MSNQLTLPITVVVPLYNKEATIERCLQSIARQSRLPSEIVVIDDASSDASKAIAERFAFQSNVPVRIISRARNSGAGASRNEGIRAAKSEWVAFLDADDYWLEDFCDDVWAALQLSDADFAAACFEVQDHRNPSTSSDRIVVTQAAIQDRLFWRHALSRFPVNSSCVIARRSLVLRVGGFAEDVRIYEDVTLWSKLWLEGRFVHCSRVLAVYDRIPGGITSSRKSNRDVRLFAYRLLGVATSAAFRGRPGWTWAWLFWLRFMAVWPVSALRTALFFRHQRDSA